MKLLTQALLEQLPPLYATEGDPDPLVICKFFYPAFHWNWFATEYDGADLFFGVVAGDFVEMGYFSLNELKETRDKLGLPIERDLYFTPCHLSALTGKLRAEYGAHCLI